MSNGKKVQFVGMVNSGGWYLEMEMESQDGELHDWYGSSYRGSEEY